jgi:hypothetical protein
MSQEPNESNELLIASLLQEALDTRKAPHNQRLAEVEAELSQVLGAAAYLQNTNRGPLLSQAELQDLAHELERQARLTQQTSPEEERDAQELRHALEGQEVSGNAQVAEAFAAASFLQHSQQTLGADFLLHLGQEVEQAARESLIIPATPQEEQAAAVLRQVLAGDHRVLSSAEVHQQVEAALGAAAYLRNTAAPALLSTTELNQLTQEVTQEATLRLQKRKRIALLGGASLLALAASAVLLLGPIFRGPKQATLEARFPSPPMLEQEILPGSDPLERLDPVYEAGLRGMREARFLGAHYASQNAH